MQRWLAENRSAMEAWTDYVGRHGLPLAEFRSVLMARLDPRLG